MNKFNVIPITILFALLVYALPVYAGTPGAATIDTDFGCGIPQGLCNTNGCCSWDVTDPRNIEIITNDANGNVILKCHTWDSTTNCVDKRAAIFRNFSCATELGSTSETFLFVTRQGYSQLTCVINPGSTAFDNPND